MTSRGVSTSADLTVCLDCGSPPIPATLAVSRPPRGRIPQNWIAHAVSPKWQDLPTEAINPRCHDKMAVEDIIDIISGDSASDRGIANAAHCARRRHPRWRPRKGAGFFVDAGTSGRPASSKPPKCRSRLARPRARAAIMAGGREAVFRARGRRDNFERPECLAPPGHQTRRHIGVSASGIT